MFALLAAHQCLLFGKIDVDECLVYDIETHTLYLGPVIGVSIWIVIAIFVVRAWLGHTYDPRMDPHVHQSLYLLVPFGIIVGALCILTHEFFPQLDW